jgi:hypothetical protein
MEAVSAFGIRKASKDLAGRLEGSDKAEVT